MENKEVLVEKIKKYLAKNGCETDKIDVFAEYDSAIKFDENKRVFHEKYVASRIKTEPTKSDIEINQVREHDCIVALENEYEKIHEQSIAYIKSSKTTDLLDKAYKIFREIITTVVKSKKIHGCIIESSTGLGKSYTCIKHLSSMGYELNKDFVILTGYITPLALYKFLYTNHNRVIIMDDITTMFDNETARGLLLAALYHPSGKRIVAYESTSDKLDVPKTFEFEGTIIWLVNKLPNGIDNIKSRVLYYPFEFTHSEQIRLMYEIANVNNIPEYIIDYIKEHSDESVRLDLRVPEKLNEIRITLGEDKWKTHADEILSIETNDELKLIIDLLGKNISVKEACREFIELTGRSRRHFFNLKKKLKGAKCKWDCTEDVSGKCKSAKDLKM